MRIYLFVCFVCLNYKRLPHYPIPIASNLKKDWAVPLSHWFHPSPAISQFKYFKICKSLHFVFVYILQSPKCFGIAVV